MAPDEDQVRVREGREREREREGERERESESAQQSNEVIFHPPGDSSTRDHGKGSGGDRHLEPRQRVGRLVRHIELVGRPRHLPRGHDGRRRQEGSRGRRRRRRGDTIDTSDTIDTGVLAAGLFRRFCPQRGRRLPPAWGKNKRECEWRGGGRGRGRGREREGGCAQAARLPMNHWPSNMGQPPP